MFFSPASSALSTVFLMRKEGREEGRKGGRKAERKGGRQKGKEEGREGGRGKREIEKGKKEDFLTLFNLMHDNKQKSNCLTEFLGFLKYIFTKNVITRHK